VLANTYDANGNTLGANGKSYAYDSMDRMDELQQRLGEDWSTMATGTAWRRPSAALTTQYLVDELNRRGCRR